MKMTLSALRNLAKPLINDKYKIARLIDCLRKDDTRAPSKILRSLEDIALEIHQQIVFHAKASRETNRQKLLKEFLADERATFAPLIEALKEKGLPSV